MYKRIVSLLLCLVTIFSFVVPANAVTIEYRDKDGYLVKIDDFFDTKGHWAHDTILKCAEYGLVQGYNGNFMPNNPITRGDLAIVIDRMLGLKNIAYNNFRDLSNEAYFRDSILKCVSEGYITGVSANELNPTGYATREQVATIICRIFEIDTSYYGVTSFKDDSKISSWAKPSVAAVQRLGYMVGDQNKNFNPKSNITRAELITLINNIANTYIPKRDAESLGTEFKGSFPTNIVTSRNISLIKSTVGRDLVLTPDAKSVDLTDTTILGRLLVMSKATIDLKSCTISQIRLLDGKSTVDGIDEGISEVYIDIDASESTLDTYPAKLVLEAGTRVKIDGKMYENDTNVTKVYLGLELLEDLADEQGYVVGGAKISGVKFYQDVDNVIRVEDIKIKMGESRIKEVGVVWLYQESDEEVVNPTYKNNDGKTIYQSNKISEPFGFTVGKVDGLCAYRVYAIDEEGLFAYSETYLFNVYDFDISMKILENKYPEKLDVEIVLTGDSIPEIRSVRVVHDRHETYSENHKQESMRLYVDYDAESQHDKSKYQRYTATLVSESERDKNTDEYIYYPSTAFGYIITFADGTIINRFPVLTEAYPEGAKPISSLNIGTVSFSGNNKIVLSNNKLVTSYVAVQEVGIVYCESTAQSVSSPSANSMGWNLIPCGYNIDANDRYTFSANIFTSNVNGYTYYAPYVKTSNGYYYGSVSKIANNWAGDKDGPKITGNLFASVLDENTVVLTIPFDSDEDIDLYATAIEVATKNGNVDNTLQGGYLREFNCHVNNADKTISICLDNLSSNSEYGITLRLTDTEGLVSNIASVNFNTSNMVPIYLADKDSNNDWTTYKIILPDSENYKITDCKIIGKGRVSLSQEGSYYMVSVIDVPDLSKGTIMVYCEYYVEKTFTTQKYYSFVREISLYK